MLNKGCYGVSHNDNTHNDIIHNDVTHNVSSHNTTLVIKDVSHNDITHNTKGPATFVIILNLGVAMSVVIIKKMTTYNSQYQKVLK